MNVTVPVSYDKICLQSGIREMPLGYSGANPSFIVETLGH